MTTSASPARVLMVQKKVQLRPHTSSSAALSKNLREDTYGPEEQALGWYYYLEENLHFPFSARCIAQRAISPLKLGEKVEVVGMPPEEDCKHKKFVLIRRKSDQFGVPLAQLESIDVDKETQRPSKIGTIG